ncbi:FAD-binding protein [Myxococcota bacterium]|nr:FAD-binding protein [Myxococcota bacterium]
MSAPSLPIAAVAERLRSVPGLMAREDEPMSRHTAWRVGGPAALWVVVETEEALLEAVGIIREANERVVPVDGQHLWVGDGGVDGVWLRLGACAEGVQRDGLRLDVGAQTPVAALASYARREGLIGLEGTINTSGTVAELLRREEPPPTLVGVRVLRGGRLAEVTPDKLKEDHVIVRARFVLDPAQALKGGRNPKRGPGLPGRLFLDPKKNHSAAEMMSELGLRGVRLRGARLGGFEPNTLINLGGAKENDLKVLIGMVKDRAKSHLGVDLNPELKPLGRSRRSDG